MIRFRFGMRRSGGLSSKTESLASRAGSLPHWIEVFTHHVFTEDPSVGASLLAIGATRYQAWWVIRPSIKV
ncbi:hypothetical protein PBDP_5521 [Pseudomonas sp. St290]|nr:hypothetical protein PBDP_5521 [Pseudomonas sp. St290]